jgi:hypothetical protein
MSRAAASDIVPVKPTNNIYTVLLAAAIVAQAIGFIALFFSYSDVFGTGSSLFS